MLICHRTWSHYHLFYIISNPKHGKNVPWFTKEIQEIIIQHLIDSKFVKKETNLDLSANTASITVGNSSVNVFVNTTSISISNVSVPTITTVIAYNLAF